MKELNEYEAEVRRRIDEKNDRRRRRSKTLGVILPLMLCIVIVAAAVPAMRGRDGTAVKTAKTEMSETEPYSGEKDTSTDSVKETVREGKNVSEEDVTYIYSDGIEMAPDLSFTLYRSDTVVKGTVLSRISEKHTNPSGKGVNVDGDPIGNAMVTRYTFRVDESFLGEPKAGEVITVGVVNHDMMPYEYFSDPNIVVEDDKEYFLEEGQEGVFCLLYDRTLAATEEDICYLVMHNDYGVFTSEDGEHYVSAKGTELDVSTLPAVIEESKAKWEEIMKNTPDI